MADEDEDLSHLRAPDAADVDPTEETQDYRALDKLAPHDVYSLSLPKRGEKDFESHSTNLQLSTLEASRNAMHRVLSWRRTHLPKNHVLGLYHADSNMASVAKVKTSHFLTIGRSRGGKEWLLPEEALFMIERGSLDCRWPVAGREKDKGEEEGVPMSLQGAYAAFIGFEDGVGGKLTLEMYTVYAGLKRAGYVVFRHGNWDDDRAVIEPLTQTSHNEKAGKGYWTRFFAQIWNRISTPTHTISPQNLAYGPLVKPGLYRSYADIYRLLNTHPIPTHTPTPTSPPTFLLPPNPQNPYRLHFDVWKTSGSQKFRKSSPPTPHFRVCVINARETNIPTAAQLNDLLATVPDDAPKQQEGQGNLFQKLKQGRRNVLLAVVDGGVPSYIRVAEGDFSSEKVYERGARGPRQKGGGRGGGRGGRGRGRGRGR